MAALRREAWSLRYETDQGVGSRRGVFVMEKKDGSNMKEGIATRVNLEESGAKYDVCLKVCNSSPLVSPTAAINMPRGLYNIDDATTFRVSLTTVGDLHMLIKCIEDGKLDELLFGMTNDDRIETLNVLGSICNSINADNTNDDVISCKVSHVDDSTMAENNNVDESKLPSIVQAMDICEEFTKVQDDATLTFITDLGYKGPLHKYTSMYVDHMHQPWRTLATIINKYLSGKTGSNDRLRKSRIDILKEKKSRRKTMPFPRFTKVIINYFLSQYKSLSKLKFQHYHTIKDDEVQRGVVIQDTPSAPKPKLATSELKLKGVQSLTLKEQNATEIMQALKESEKTNQRLPEKKDNNRDVDDEDEDDDHISDIQDTNDGDVETEYDEHEIYKYKIQVHKDVDTTEEKGDGELAGNAMTSKYQVKVSIEFPLPSSILSVSSGCKIQKPTIDLVPEYEKSPLEIHKIKKELAKKQKMLRYTIKSTDKATLIEYDLKSSLYQKMNENKSFNKNLVNHALYHALMQALIEDENPMDKGGKKIKRRRTKESKSSMKPSTTKETSKGKALSKSSKTSKSVTTKKPIEELIAEVVMNDQEINTNEDVVNDADRPQHGTCTSSIKLEYNIAKFFKLLTDKLDWNNPEGDHCPFDLTKPVPLKGRPCHLTVAAEYFFNNDLEFLKSSDSEKNYTMSIIKTKIARCEIAGIEDMVLTLWSPIKYGYDKDAKKGIKH
nr:hypothetical protein [Tanacetum cinerariifolium]